MSDNLQKSRKEKIPELVDKYQKLVNEIFEAVTKPLPVFKDVSIDNDGKEATVITAEQQMFAFINVRNQALDSANNMLLKINNLEMELYAPEAFYAQKNEDVKEDEGTNKKTSWTKKKATETK